MKYSAVFVLSYDAVYCGHGQPFFLGCGVQNASDEADEGIGVGSHRLCSALYALVPHFGRLQDIPSRNFKEYGHVDRGLSAYSQSSESGSPFDPSDGAFDAGSLGVCLSPGFASFFVQTRSAPALGFRMLETAARVTFYGAAATLWATPAVCGVEVGSGDAVLGVVLGL